MEKGVPPAAGGDRERAGPIRSWLLVRADEDAAETALASSPDGLILEIGARAGGLDKAAELLARLRSRHVAPALFVRIASVDICADADFPSLMDAHPDGVMLAAEGARDVSRLGARLAALEAEHGLADGRTRIIASIETARGALLLPSLADAGPRLLGITVSTGPLSEALGCEFDIEGAWPGPLARIRDLAIIVAAACGCAAIEDADQPRLPPAQVAPGLRESSRGGFRAKLTRDPPQVASINAAFGALRRSSDG